MAKDNIGTHWKILVSHEDQLRRFSISPQRMRVYRGLAMTCACATAALILCVGYQTGRNVFLSRELDRYKSHIELQQKSIALLNRENHQGMTALWELGRQLHAFERQLETTDQENLGNRLALLGQAHDQLDRRLVKTAAMYLEAAPDGVSHAALQSEVAALERDIRSTHSRVDRLKQLTISVGEGENGEVQHALEQISGAQEGFSLLQEVVVGAMERRRLPLRGSDLGDSCSVDHAHLSKASVRSAVSSLQAAADLGRETSRLVSATFQDLGFLARHDAMERSLAAYLEASQALYDALSSYASLPTGYPVDYDINSEYGRRNDPFTGRNRMHRGLDFAAPEGAQIYAPAAGRVSYAGWRGSYGLMVEIDHGQGVRSRYAHLSSASVETGDTVSPGIGIGAVGSTGRSTGAHLHYEILINGKQVDPQHFVLAEAGALPCSSLVSRTKKQEGEKYDVSEEG